jgi:hypothetical protein
LTLDQKEPVDSRPSARLCKKRRHIPVLDSFEGHMRALYKEEMAVVSGGSATVTRSGNGVGNGSQNGVQNASRGGRNIFTSQLLVGDANVNAAPTAIDNSNSTTTAISI